MRVRASTWSHSKPGDEHRATQENRLGVDDGSAAANDAGSDDLDGAIELTARRMGLVNVQSAG